MTKAEHSKKWRKENPEFNKQWRQENPEKIKEYNKKWRKENPEYQEKYQKQWRKENPEHQKQWRKENPEKVKENGKRWHKQRRQIDPKYRLDRIIGSAIRHSLRGKKAGRTWKKLVGYSIENLAKHLENQFDEKMTWNNYGSYWWVDHIKPKSLFHYENAEDPEFKKCWALENLQPLEKIANIKKSNHF